MSAQTKKFYLLVETDQLPRTKRMKHPCGMETTDREAAETYEPNRIQIAQASRIRDGYRYNYSKPFPYWSLVAIGIFLIGIIWIFTE